MIHIPAKRRRGGRWKDPPIKFIIFFNAEFPFVVFIHATLLVEEFHIEQRGGKNAKKKRNPTFWREGEKFYDNLGSINFTYSVFTPFCITQLAC